MVTQINEQTPVKHPLEPLTPQEIEVAIATVRLEKALSDKVRVVYGTLHEAAPEVALAYQPGDPITREVFLVLLDKSQDTAETYEAVVNVTEGTVTSWKHKEGVQPSIMFEEFALCEDIVKADPRFVEALAKRGIIDLSLVNIDPWSAGNYGEPEENDRRILRSTVHMRLNPSDPEENSYAHPIAGLHPIIDLVKNEVIRVDDFGVIPVPQEYGNYTSEAVGQLRTDLKPVTITQPEGPSFTVDGHHVTWQNWDLRLGYSAREGLILHHVMYNDHGKMRPILRRAALSEMVVPYGDPHMSHCRQNAFDVGEYGVGWLGNELVLGCDCLGHIVYFDAHMPASDGSVQTLRNVICMHEEDDGLLWKHTNFRTGHAETRRSRRLVISFITTVGIYEYGFFWYLYQDGTIQMDLKLTGIMNIGAVPPGVEPGYGELLAPGLYAPNHQHFFMFRLDTMVDGLNNSVEELNTAPVPMGPENPYGNAFKLERTLLTNEQEAQRVLNTASQRSWRIINPSVQHPITGKPVGYEIVSHSSALPYANTHSSFLKRAGFTTNHLWVTPYDAEERYPAGEYPNQHPGGAGLPAWTQANREVTDRPIVVWLNVGVHHLARIEEWPVMPVTHKGFSLRPNGFFSRNPGLDVPPSMPHHEEHGDCCAS